MAAPVATNTAASEEEAAEVPEIILDLPPAPDQGAAVVLTEAGLPRRPMTKLRSGVEVRLPAAPPPGSGSAPPAVELELETDLRARSPEGVRSMLNSYQAGLQRGRRAAATTRTATRNGAPPGSRSDGQPGSHP